jgi:membrane dipeptidase
MSDGLQVVDGHNDTLLDLHLGERGGGRSFLDRGDAGHVDLPRAREGGYAGGFFAVFVPNEGTSELRETADGYEVPLADPVDHGRAKSFTYDVLERLYRLERASDGAVRVVGSVDELRACLAGGVLAAIPHLEGAEAVAEDRSNLDFLHAAGVRSIGLAWSRPNAFGTGVPFAFPGGPDVGEGLTAAGRDLVRACAERGIVVDLAHLNERGFRDVAALSEAPLVASHAAAHRLCPSTRNLTDEQLDAIGRSDGVVGISFCVENLHPEGRQDPSVPLSTLLDHVEYVADRIGIDHVGLGSDFDGAVVPEAIGDAAGLPVLLDALRDRGFDDRDLERLARGNWLRVLEATW